MRLWNELISQPDRKARIEQKLPADSAAEVHVVERRDGSFIVAPWLRPDKTVRAGAATLVIDDRSETLDVQSPPDRALHLSVHRGAVANQIAADAKLAGVLPGVIARGDDIFIAELRQR